MHVTFVIFGCNEQKLIRFINFIHKIRNFLMWRNFKKAVIKSFNFYRTRPDRAIRDNLHSDFQKYLASLIPIPRINRETLPSNKPLISIMKQTGDNKSRFCLIFTFRLSSRMIQDISVIIIKNIYFPCFATSPSKEQSLLWKLTEENWKF